jgi:adenylylsulfate kinase
MEHQGFTVWFTGLSGAGKTTLGTLLEQELKGRGMKVELLDADLVRQNLCKGLGYSKEDRDTNIRRIGLVCHLLSRNGVAVIAAAIAPYAEVRAENRALIGDYVEVHVDCSLEQLQARDPKGLYEKALRGEIKHFTGVDDPYERPEHPDLRIPTGEEPPAASLRRILDLLGARGYLPSR